jgi:hypothetical protein
MKKILMLFFSLLLASCGTFSNNSNGYHFGPNISTIPNTPPDNTQVIHQYAAIGKGIARQIYSRTSYDYDSLPTKPNDLYYHGSVTVIGRM